MKLAWLTDVHLDHIESYEFNGKIRNFCDKVLKHSPDAIVITGDITSAKFLKINFGQLMLHWEEVPVYFVFGNHDFYHGSFASVDKEIKTLTKGSNFHYLTQESVIELTPDTALVGHDGFYDGGYSDWFAEGVVIMNDYYCIKEFIPALGKPQAIFDIMQQKAKECAEHIRLHLPVAMSKYKNTIFATHVPPFKQAAIHEGKTSNWQWLPNFSSKLAGDALLEVAGKYLDKKLTVLCGHTHGEGDYMETENIQCLTGFSQYGEPTMSLKIIEVD